MMQKVLVGFQVMILLVVRPSSQNVEFSSKTLFNDGSGEGLKSMNENEVGSGNGLNFIDENEIIFGDPTVNSVNTDSGPSSIICHTVYEPSWQTVYHEYEEDVCKSFSEQVCQPFTRTSCSSVERRQCRSQNITECGLDYTEEVEDYVETECKEVCQEDCVFHWETESDGSKVWVPDTNNCITRSQEKCQDVPKVSKVKKYLSMVKTKEAEVCELVSTIECHSEEDQFCFETTRCICDKVHKKVPIRVSTKVAKKKCFNKSHPTTSEIPSNRSLPNSPSCPTVSSKPPQECRGQMSTCWSPDVADLDCPKHANTGISDQDWGYCCFDGCANTCFNSSSSHSPKISSFTENPCQPNPCGTGAMCIPQEGQAMCKCPEGLFPDPTPEVACSPSLIDLRNTPPPS